MKQLFIILLLLCNNMIFAQSSRFINSMFMAHQYADAKNPLYNPKMAFEIFSQKAEEGNPKAMNGLGILYSNGIGTSANPEVALQWFQKAANIGYPAGYYNVALMYKDGIGCEQNFKKAYEYFSKSAALNHIGGIYGKGYMLYKGLGCEQDYREAFALFSKSAPKGATGSMYMLGLCYRNGYGTEVNLDSARYWIQKVAAKGDQRAIAEMGEPEPENNFMQKATENGRAATKTAIRPEERTFRKVQQNTKKGELEGTYTGYIIRYDWSGKHIIGQSELSLTLNGEDKHLVGKWAEGEISPIDIQVELTDSGLVFNNTTYQRGDHYRKKEPSNLEFRNAKLQLIGDKDSVYLIGNLQLFSLTAKEPAQPTYINLMRQPILKQKALANASELNTTVKNKLSETAISDESIFDKVMVYPNPFLQSFRVSFNLQAAGKVHLYLGSMNGSLIYQKTISLTAGQHTEDIVVDVPPGAYTFRIKYGEKSYSSIVIKQ